MEVEGLKHRFGRFRGAKVKGWFHAGSLYLVSGVGVKHKRNMDILDAVASTLKSLAGRWIIGGGFNWTPAQLTETGWLRVVGRGDRGSQCRHMS